MSRSYGRWFTDSLVEASHYAAARSGYIVYVDVHPVLAERWSAFEILGHYFFVPKSYADIAEKLTRKTPPPPPGRLRIYRGEWLTPHEEKLRQRTRARLLRRNPTEQKRVYCICYPLDGLLYVEVPNFESLRTLLIQQRFRRHAHFRTVQGYVPYGGGGVAFPASYLALLGVKPLWYMSSLDRLRAMPGRQERHDKAIRELIADGIYEDEHEAFHYDGHQYGGECEWEGPPGMRFDPRHIAFVWFGYERRTYPAETRALFLRAILPPHVDILHEAPEKMWGPSPCR